MRHFLITTALLAAGPALAARFEAPAPVRDAVIYPQGASITREARLDLPQGAHELVIPGLPAGTDPATLRVSVDGAALGAVSLQQLRALPDSPVKSPELTAAEADVQRLEDVLAQRDAEVARIKAKADAARDVIDFLMALAESDGAGNHDIGALAATVGQQILQARQTMIDATAAARHAAQGRDEQQAELDRAKARLQALRLPDGDATALVLALQGRGQPATIRITSVTGAAGWQPAYDVTLDRAAAQVTLAPGLLVHQSSGEDWSGVRLRLSTAQPLRQAGPSQLEPLFPQLIAPQAEAASSRMAGAAYDMAAPAFAAPGAGLAAPAPVAESALTGFQGQVVVYDYPTPVNLRDGADALRLPLDPVQIKAQVLAEAVPRRDDRAYLVADVTNSTGAVILPGEATFRVDGALVGRGALALTAAGDEMTLGFGPLNGLLLERLLPQEMQGDRGLLARVNERQETATLRLRNLTDQDWTVRVIDQVPVSTQKDLRIDWTAAPQPDQTDPKGKRGLLVWNRAVAAGQTDQISLTTTLRWPEGRQLIGGY